MAYFSALNYSLGEEDSMPEYHILKTFSKPTILSVTGSGSRIIPLLACHPQKLTCIDISPWQLAITALRLGALAKLDYPDYLMFMGYHPGMDSIRRKKVFNSLNITKKFREQAKILLSKVEWTAPLYIGRFEYMLHKLYKINTFITRAQARGIFECDTIEKQQHYYATKFPRKRWAMVIKLLGNATVLNSLLYHGEFPRNNMGIRTSKFYSQIFDQLFKNTLARKSFFLQMLFFGKINFEEAFCGEANQDIFLSAQSAQRDCEIQFQQGSISELIKQDNQFNFLSLSDVPSFLSDNDARKILQQLRAHLTCGGILVFRSHLRHIKPISYGYLDVSSHFKPVTDLETSGLWRFSIFKKEN